MKNNVIVNKTEVVLHTKPVRTRNAKPVYCITTGEVFASGLDAAEATGVNAVNISNVCSGKQKTSNGKQFCFVKDMQAHILEISDAMAAARKEGIASAAEAKRKQLIEKRKEIEARIEKERRQLENIDVELAKFA